MADTADKNMSKFSDLADTTVTIDKDSVIKQVDALNGDGEEAAEARAMAADEVYAAYEDIRASLREGRITETGLRRVAGVNDIDVDEMLRFAKMSRLEMEMDSLYKSDLSDAEDTMSVDGKYIYPNKVGDVVEAAGVKLTRTADNTIKCESEYLGNFSYDTNQFDVRFKMIQEDDGSTSYLPYLKYEGDDELGYTPDTPIADFYDEKCIAYEENFKNGEYGKGIANFGLATLSSIPGVTSDLIWGAASGFDDNQTMGDDTVYVPEGLKVMDYMFEGRSKLEHFPDHIPESVTSMHAAFKGCSSMTVDYRGYQDQVIDLPSGITDLSLCFKDCGSLQCEFHSDGERQLPKNVVNITEMLTECESVSNGVAVANARPNGHRNLGISRHPWKLTSDSAVMSIGKVDYRLPHVGSEYTPYLSAALARDWLAGISGKEDQEAIKQYADNIEYVVDYTGAINDKFKEQAKSLDQKKLDEVQTAATVYYQGDSHLGSIMSHAELASGGARSDNKIMNEDGSFSYDLTGLKNSFQAETDGDSFLMKLAMYGGTAAAGAVVTDLTSRLLTKNKVHNAYLNLAGGVVSTVAMQAAFPKLYESAYPILTTIRDHIPDAGVFSSIKNGLTDYINEHYSSKIVNEKVKARNDMWDKADSYDMAVAYLAGKDPNGDNLMYANDGVRPATSPLTDIFDRTYNMAYMWDDVSECDALMKTSAASCADTDTFLVLSTYVDDETNTFRDLSTPVTESIKTGTDKIEEFWKACHEKVVSGETTDWDDDMIREDMRTFYKFMLHSISTYDDAASVSINEHYGIDTQSCRLAKEGLGMVNGAYMETLMQSMKEMESEFHFMNDEMQDAIADTHLTGVKVDGLTVRHVTAETYEVDRDAFCKSRYGSSFAPESNVVTEDVPKPTPESSTVALTQDMSALDVVDEQITKPVISRSEMSDVPDDNISENEDEVVL